MHLIEKYSLSCGVKIGQPFLYTSYFPLAFDNEYITLHPYSKDAKNFDLWQDCINLLLPVFKEHNISIVQIGAKGERSLEGVHCVAGQTDYKQVGYLIQNSILHLGADSFPVHIASSCQKKIVALYSNNYINCVGPYWTKPEDCILLEPDRTNKKPSFSLQENPKTINEIKPEKVAESVCKLLNLSFDYPYKTIKVGAFYHNRTLEVVPDAVTRINGLDFLLIRMDWHFNEQNLEKQLQLNKCSIVTNKPINIEIISRYKDRINEVFYLVEEENSPAFVAQMRGLGMKFTMVSHLPKERVQNLKLDYMDYGIIHIKEKREFNLPLENLYYKSNKFTISLGKMYPSKQAWKEGVEIKSFNDNLLPVEKVDDDFLTELEHFMLLEKTNKL